MSTVADRFLSISLKDGKLAVARRESGEELLLDWPGVRVSVGGREIRPTRPCGQVKASRRALSQAFEKQGLRFVVTVTLSGSAWFRKSLAISSEAAPLTPDFVEVDRQALPGDELRACGYRATTPRTARNSDEEGAGIMPGCGYPLIGKRFFAGLEHPAAFNGVVRRRGKDVIRLRHHPVWDGRDLGQVDAVFGWADDARANFADYLDTIRLPVLPQPLVAFGTFWTDPYVGAYEYETSEQAYAAFFRAFNELGLDPDVFTLDAGWFDRRSVFQAKREVGRDAGLIRLRRLAERQGGGLSLWITHNGPIGVAPEYMKEQGWEVGGGNSSAYCGDGYGVMMDQRFFAAVADRFHELAGKVGVRHFKIDWDNDCATNEKFDAVHPTRDHVREASVNAFIRIARTLRERAPGFLTRDGWWPSPWWLRDASHIWLADSGDSEFAALPSKTQRDSASTHRDVMYYNVLVRDGSAVPLDCFDNHELPDAPRNPFPEDPVAWVNATWLCFLRGATYIPYTLAPESLEDWQVESLRSIMAFCRSHARSIYVARGRMVLGDPGRGEVYGFVQPGRAESWCVLRNPRAFPQTVAFDPEAIAGHGVKTVVQFYPHFEHLSPKQGLTFLAHEVKAVVFAARAEKPRFAAPYMVAAEGTGFHYRFPASMAASGPVGPMVDELHRLPGLECTWAGRNAVENGVRFQWYLTVPYRMRETELQLCLKGPGARRVQPRAFSCRYRGGASGYALPVTRIPIGDPGHGERKNLDPPRIEDEVYYAIRIADGGRVNITLTLADMPAQGVAVSAWLAGHEAPSRNAVVRKRAPARFAACLPYQHPLGFGAALELPLPEQE